MTNQAFSLLTKLIGMFFWYAMHQNSYCMVTLKKILGLQFLMVAFFIGACNSNSNKGTGNDTTNSVLNQDTLHKDLKQAEGKTEEAASQTATTVQESLSQNPDSVFIAEVAANNNEEIAVLQAGLAQGNDKTLKSDARMMLADHKGLKNKLQKYADKNNYIIPADDGGNAAKVLDQMNSKTGKDWDLAWANFMFDAHEKAIGKFEGSLNHVNDDNLKALINNTLPALKSHLEMAKKLQEKFR